MIMHFTYVCHASIKLHNIFRSDLLSFLLVASPVRTMSILRYFTKISTSNINAAASTSQLTELETTSVVDSVHMAVPRPTQKRKRKNGRYDAVKRAEIAKWAISNGARATGRQFGINASTVWGMVKQFQIRNTEFPVILMCFISALPKLGQLLTSVYSSRGDS